MYVGDDLEVDILGCQNYGIDGLFFNPKKPIIVTGTNIRCVKKWK